MRRARTFMRFSICEQSTEFKQEHNPKNVKPRYVRHTVGLNTYSWVTLNDIKSSVSLGFTGSWFKVCQSTAKRTVLTLAHLSALCVISQIKCVLELEDQQVSYLLSRLFISTSVLINSAWNRNKVYLAKIHRRLFVINKHTPAPHCARLSQDRIKINLNTSHTLQIESGSVTVTEQ